jgi:hypothetical protein
LQYTAECSEAVTERVLRAPGWVVPVGQATVEFSQPLYTDQFRLEEGTGSSYKVHGTDLSKCKGNPRLASLMQPATFLILNVYV